jgi:hypothetical protein
MPLIAISGIASEIKCCGSGTGNGRNMAAWEHLVERIKTLEQQVEELGDGRHRTLLALVLGGHVASVPAHGEDLPHAIEVNGTMAVTEVITNVRVRGVRDAGFNLPVLVFVRVGDEIRDVKVHTRER